MSRASSEIPSCADCTNDSKIFCALSRDEKGELSHNKGSNFYKKGQAIFYEGNHSHGLYCIFTGKVKLSKLGEDGKVQVIRFAKTADILGYRALLSNEPYHATAIAMEDCQICHLSKDRYLQLMTENPKLAWNTMQLLSKDLRSAEQHLINIAQKTVKERIAEALMLLYSTFGMKEDGKSIDIVLSRSEIADIAGTTTETTIRTLALLSKEGLIELKGKVIKIENIAALTRTAGIYD